MESYYPFDAGAGSTVAESQWQKFARRFVRTGVLVGYLNTLAVSASGSAMQVTLASGGAWIEGFYYENDAPLVVPVSPADASNARIDRIVIRLDRTANTIAAAVLQGVPASSPVAPALTQTDSLYELPVATVTVPAAVGVVQNSNVADARVFAVDIKSHHEATDPHPQYATDADLTAHVAATDPHPQYLTATEGNSLFLTEAEGDTRYAPVSGVDAATLDGLDSSDLLRSKTAGAGLKLLHRRNHAVNVVGASGDATFPFGTTFGAAPAVVFSDTIGTGTYRVRLVSTTTSGFTVRSESTVDNSPIPAGSLITLDYFAVGT